MTNTQTWILLVEVGVIALMAVIGRLPPRP
jgi:hypothetical protein